MALAPRSLLLVLGLLAATSCDSFEGPPEVAIVGLKEGRLSTNQAPLVLAFSKPVDESTLRVKVMRLQTDIEGNLEGDPNVLPGTVSPVLFSRESDGSTTGGTARMLDDRMGLVITPKEDALFPIGPSLALVIEPGLHAASDSVTTNVRRRLPFGYDVPSVPAAPPGPFVSGQYFFLVSVEKPLGLQVQLWANLVVDPTNGSFKGQFTNADRLTDPNRCPTPCDKSKVCRLLPAPACVAPSEKAAAVDEFPDFFANNSPPAGFTFTAAGLAQELSPGVVTFSNQPTDAKLAQPDVTINKIELAGSFTVDDQGVLRGTGTFKSPQVIFLETDSGPASGTFDARLIPVAQQDPNAPPPPT